MGILQEGEREKLLISLFFFDEENVFGFTMSKCKEASVR
jgi:hypothetical protein